MASYIPIKSSVTFKLDRGTVDGKKLTKSISVSKVRMSTAAGDVNDTLDALSAAFSYPVIERTKTDVNSVLA